MRVIAGSARRLQLQTPKGMETRPTLDREKETLFNMLNVGLGGAYFLDLFSGSGQIGIEALSRGAKQAYFVEQGREALACIRQNLNTTHLADKGVVMANDVFAAISMLSTKGIVFDYIYMDPPYGNLLEKNVLYALADSPIVNEDTVIIVESDLQTSFDYLDELPFAIYKEKCYKTNKHTFFERISS